MKAITIGNMVPYNKKLLKDPNFREFYSNNLHRAVFTFPKFTRNYSKNYKQVQHSFRKTCKSNCSFCLFVLELKTIVLDIDETLVYATMNRSEVKILDETIFIKMTKFGGMAKAYLSYRPFLFEFLDLLRE